jgi:hypothetical protein
MGVVRSLRQSNPVCSLTASLRPSRQFGFQEAYEPEFRLSMSPQDFVACCLQLVATKSLHLDELALVPDGAENGLVAGR